MIAAGVIGVLALLRRLRRLAALPTGLLLFAALAAGSMAEHAVTAAVVLLAVALAALVIATLPFTRARGLIPVLAAGGMLGAVLASTLGYASAALWPWTSAAVLVLAIAGRVLARRIWPQTSATAIGAAHVAIASALAMGALVALVPWLATSDVRLAAPWGAPWMWVATGGALLLAAGAFVRLGNRCRSHRVRRAGAARHRQRARRRPARRARGGVAMGARHPARRRGPRVDARVEPARDENRVRRDDTARPRVRPRHARRATVRRRRRRHRSRRRSPAGRGAGARRRPRSTARAVDHVGDRGRRGRS